MNESNMRSRYGESELSARSSGKDSHGPEHRGQRQTKSGGHSSNVLTTGFRHLKFVQHKRTSSSLTLTY